MFNNEIYFALLCFAKEKSVAENRERKKECPRAHTRKSFIMRSWIRLSFINSYFSFSFHSFYKHLHNELERKNNGNFFNSKPNCKAAIDIQYMNKMEFAIIQSAIEATFIYNTTNMFSLNFPKISIKSMRLRENFA